MEGVTKVGSVPIGDPRVAAVNHWMLLPTPVVAARLTVVVPHPVAAVLPVIVGNGVTVTITGLA